MFKIYIDDVEVKCDNQFDIEDIEVSHQRLMLLINQKSKYFEENIYKRS